MPQDPEEGFNPFMSNYRRRASNLFPSYGEPEQSEFDSSGMNKRAFGVQPFGSSYYPQQQDDNDYESSFTPSSTLKRYLDLSNNAPKRGDYTPTKWGRVLAAMTGAAEGYKGGPAKGMAAAMGVHDIPYRRAMEGYETEYTTAASALKAEQQESQLRSMADYRGGQLTEKAKDRLRKEGEARAKIDQGDRKISSTESMFGKGLQFKTDQQKADEKFEEYKLDTDRKYKQGLITARERDARNDEARNSIYGRMAGAAEEQARAATVRAANSGDDDDIPGVNPSVIQNADELARSEVRRQYPQWRGFFDKKGELKPPGDWLFGLVESDKSEYYKAAAEVERRKKGYVEGSKKTQTPRRSAPVVNPNVAPQRPVQKTQW